MVHYPKNQGKENLQKCTAEYVQGISSSTQRIKALESGFFLLTEDSVSISNKDVIHTGEHTPEHTPGHTLEHTPEHIPEHTQVPYSQELDKEIDKEKIVLKEKSAADDEISYIKKILLDNNETLWRQTLLMQCPFGDQLKDSGTKQKSGLKGPSGCKGRPEGSLSNSPIPLGLGSYGGQRDTRRGL